MVRLWLPQVMAGQDALERKLSLVEMHQKGIHDTLVSMEGEAERLYKEERALLDDDARCAEAVSSLSMQEHRRFNGGCSPWCLPACLLDRLFMPSRRVV